MLNSYIDERLEEFRLYKDGWDNGRGRTLSDASVKLFNVLHFASSLPPDTSIFLTRNGNLQLVYDLDSGKKVEVEIFPDHLEYYISQRREGKQTMKEEDRICRLYNFKAGETIRCSEVNEEFNQLVSIVNTLSFRMCKLEGEIEKTRVFVRRKTESIAENLVAQGQKLNELADHMSKLWDVQIENSTRLDDIEKKG